MSGDDGRAVDQSPTVPRHDTKSRLVYRSTTPHAIRGPAFPDGSVR